VLKERIITALVALATLGIVLFVLPQFAAELVIAIVVLAGAWEWSAFLESRSVLLRIVYVSLIAAGIAAINLAAPEAAIPVLKLALIWWAVALIWTFFFPTPIPLFFRWLCGALVLIPLYVALVMLYELGPPLLLFALFIVWAADIGAYFAGKRFGRVKLAPGISPGKTWEGAIGGLVFVTALILLRSLWVDTQLAVLVPFCLAVAGASIVGDLTVSMFKRTAGLKDSGKLFPGHGGVLDRIDSVSAATPLFALGLPWLGLS
jgi:phosphatidate cytidylyltransferase